MVPLVFAFNTLVKFTIIYHTIGLTKSSPNSLNIKLYSKMRCGIYLFLNNVFYTLCFEKYFMVTNDQSCYSLNCWCNRKIVQSDKGLVLFVIGPILILSLSFRANYNTSLLLVIAAVYLNLMDYESTFLIPT